jgi:hypothetical protein
MGGHDFPAPDRSDFVPITTKSAENDLLDIGWNSGILSDSRPFRMECWAQDGVTMLTFFIPAKENETGGDDYFAGLLQSEGLVTFNPGPRYVSGAKFRDRSGNLVWSVNVVVADDEDTFVSSSPMLHRYETQSDQSGDARVEDA